MPAPAKVTLDPELVSKVKALTFEQKERLSDEMWDVGEALPPLEDIDWPKEIERRCKLIESGHAQLLTKEEVDASVRDLFRQHGLEV